MSIRTFVAIELAGPVKARAEKFIQQLRAANAKVTWVKPHNMHLTLKFLGDLPDNDVPEVCRIVADAPPSVEVIPSLVLRTTRSTLWTDADGAAFDQSAAPLFDAYGRLVGLGSRRHAAGLLNVRVVEWPAVAGRLRAGEAWGEWPTTVAPRTP